MPLRPLSGAGQAADDRVEALHLYASTGSNRGGARYGASPDFLRKLP
jgi:hypothetical protein